MGLGGRQVGLKWASSGSHACFFSGSIRARVRRSKTYSNPRKTQDSTAQRFPRGSEKSKSLHQTSKIGNATFPRSSRNAVKPMENNHFSATGGRHETAGDHDLSKRLHQTSLVFFLSRFVRAHAAPKPTETRENSRIARGAISKKN